MKNINAGTVKFDQDRDTADVFNNNNAIKRWRRIHSVDRIISQEKMSLILRSDDTKKCWISDLTAQQKKEERNSDKVNEEKEAAIFNV